MLKAKAGHVEFYGSKIMILAELTQLINQLLVSEVIDNDDLEECVRLAKLSIEELDEELKEIKKDKTEEEKLDSRVDFMINLLRDILLEDD